MVQTMRPVLGAEELSAASPGSPTGVTLTTFLHINFLSVKTSLAPIVMAIFGVTGYFSFLKEFY